jgi:hypothetical protein
MDWLLDSGIQEGGEGGGAFFAQLGSAYGWRYSEVTGYGITLLCGAWRERRDPRALAAARRGANWLFSQARRGPAFACRREPGGEWVEHLCSFDNGMILTALVALHEATGEREPLDAAMDVARWLTHDVALPGGGLVPKTDLAHPGPVPPDRWSTRPGPYQAKVAIGLLRLARATCEAALADAARELCLAALRHQQPDGRFVTDTIVGDTYLHPHCYAVEGLAACAAALGDARLADAARRGAHWTRSILGPDGGLPCAFDGSAPADEQRSDSTAQALRLLLLLDGPGPVTDRLLERLLAFQDAGPGPARRGGFRYSSSADGPFAGLTTHGTMFAVQALMLAERGTGGFDWLDLV